MSVISLIEIIEIYIHTIQKMALISKLKKLAYIPQNFDITEYPKEIWIQSYLKSWLPKLNVDAK